MLKPKPKKEREAVADVIASAKPAIVGLVEIGGPVALQDLRERLAARHCEFPYFRVLPRKGEDRALALLSKYRISPALSSMYPQIHTPIITYNIPQLHY